MSTSAAWAPFEQALIDAHAGRSRPLTIISDVGRTEDVDPMLFFRGEDDFEAWEKTALARAEGHVLDVGAGVGPHALTLQGRGLAVTAVDALEAAVRIMEDRGVADPRVADCFELPPGPWDTILYLMNGTMPFGTLVGLESGLREARRRIAEGGRVLIDSTDLRDSPSMGDPTDADDYLGEAHYQFRYGDLAGDPVPQLFVDPDTLDRIAAAAGWTSEVLWWGPHGHYLAELRPSAGA